MTPHDLAPPKQTPLPPLHHLNLMPQLPQRVHHLLPDAFLQMHLPIQHFPLIRRAGPDAHPRRVERSLRVVLEG